MKLFIYFTQKLVKRLIINGINRSSDIEYLLQLGSGLSEPLLIVMYINRSCLMMLNVMTVLVHHNSVTTSSNSVVESELAVEFN